MSAASVEHKWAAPNVAVYLTTYSKQGVCIWEKNLHIQGEHKNTPWFQVVIKSKLTGIFL